MPKLKSNNCSIYRQFFLIVSFVSTYIFKCRMSDTDIRTTFQLINWTNLLVAFLNNRKSSNLQRRCCLIHAFILLAIHFTFHQNFVETSIITSIKDEAGPATPKLIKTTLNNYAFLTFIILKCILNFLQLYQVLMNNLFLVKLIKTLYCNKTKLRSNWNFISFEKTFENSGISQ